MKLWSDAWSNGAPIPARFAAGRLDDNGQPEFSDNLSPPLQWRDLPAGTRSLVLVCHDFDVPGGAHDGHRPSQGPGHAPGPELTADTPRVDFFHWLLVDLPPDLTGLAEGQCSRGFTPRGKPGPGCPGLVAGPSGSGNTGLPGAARQGLNDFTTWFADQPDLAGRYFGYDGPYPPANDALAHHYLFTLYAIDLARLPVEAEFTGPQVRRALTGHVLGAATWSGTYTLNRRLA